MHEASGICSLPLWDNVFTVARNPLYPPEYRLSAIDWPGAVTLDPCINTQQRMTSTT